jgi:hypothetical protein
MASAAIVAWLVAVTPSARAQSEAASRALEEKGVRAAASIDRAFVWTWQMPEFGFATDEKLVGKWRGSDVYVAKGHVVATAHHLSDDGKGVNTACTVRLEDVVAGPFAVGDTIGVDLPGGKLVFRDGTSAEFKSIIWGRAPSATYLALPTVGERFVFLMVEHRASDSIAQRKLGLSDDRDGEIPERLFDIRDTAGYSLFEVTSENLVRPRGPLQVPILRVHSGQAVEQFLVDLRRARGAG